jgi:hypothetical protein
VDIHYLSSQFLWRTLVLSTNLMPKVVKFNIDSKRIFQITHILQEVHNIQTYSAFDKKSWLQEAEAARSRYCSMFYNFEMSYIKLKISRFKFSIALSPNGVFESPSGSQSGFRGFFGGKAPKKNKAENGETDDDNESPNYSQSIHRTKSKSEQPGPTRVLSYHKKTDPMAKLEKIKKVKSQSNLISIFDSQLADDQGNSVQEEVIPILDMFRLSTTSRKIATAELTEAKAKLSPFAPSEPGSTSEIFSPTGAKRSTFIINR